MTLYTEEQSNASNEPDILDQRPQASVVFNCFSWLTQLLILASWVFYLLLHLLLIYPMPDGAAF